MTADRTAIVDLIYTSCVLLDEKKYEEWMALCTPDFRYMITAYSEEIRKEMTWLYHDADELKSLFENLPAHVRVLGTYRRQVGVFEEIGRDQETVKLNSSVIVYHTIPQGASKLFAIARYLDTVAVEDGVHRLAAREVRLETRQLEFGPHVII